MSRYKEIKTEFRNLESLKKVLADCKVECSISPNWRTPDLPMFGYRDDLRSERASIVIHREWVNGHWSGREYKGRWLDGASNDIGFAWDGQQFTAIVSAYDQGRDGVTAGLNQIRQRYSFHESMRLAHAKGYTVRETANVDGTIRIVLQKR